MFKFCIGLGPNDAARIAYFVQKCKSKAKLIDVKTQKIDLSEKAKFILGLGFKYHGLYGTVLSYWSMTLANNEPQSIKTK